MEYTAEDVLLDREKRITFQSRLTEKFRRPLINIRVNYPGTNKNNDITNSIIEYLDKFIVDIFKDDIYYKIFRITAEGPIVTMAVTGDPLVIKKKTIDIEETHLLGRCVDIDVYDQSGIGISRESLGLAPRKCFICGEPAVVCIRERRHPEWQVVQYVINKYREFMDDINGQEISDR